MKKKDFKYIIKRVIIGVLIVLILSNLKQCKVKAQQLNNDIYIWSYNMPNITEDSNALGPFIYTLNSIEFPVNGIPYTISLMEGMGHTRPTPKNPDGYWFHLVSEDNSVHYYFFVNNMSMGSYEYTINMVNFDYDTNGNFIKITLYDAETNEVASFCESGCSSNDYQINSYLIISKDSTSTYSEFMPINSIINVGFIPTSEDFTLYLNAIDFNNSYLFSNIANFIPNQYLFENFSKVDSTIPFVTLNELTIDTLIYYKELERGTYEGYSDEFYKKMISLNQKSNLENYLSMLLLPFELINIFKDSTCSSLTIPIPFVNSSITLPCISTLLHDNVGQIYNIIVIVVNGLLVYRITMRNIDTITDTLKADDDKLEVVDL